MDNLNDKAKTFLNTNKWFILVGVIAIVGFLFVGFTFGKYHPDPNSKIVQDLLTEKMKEEREATKKLINGKDIEIKSIQERLKLSNTANSSYIKSINELNNQIRNIKPPKDTKETKKILKELGYETF